MRATWPQYANSGDSTSGNKGPTGDVREAWVGSAYELQDISNKLNKSIRAKKCTEYDVIKQYYNSRIMFNLFKQKLN